MPTPPLLTSGLVAPILPIGALRLLGPVLAESSHSPLLVWLAQGPEMMKSLFVNARPAASVRHQQRVWSCGRRRGRGIRHGWLYRATRC